MPTVDVLLSTYNGQRYLGALLESVRSQVGVEPRIVSRDDGSSEGPPLVPGAARPHDVDGRDGQHMGACASYLRLLQAVAGEADYVALADQDDVWCKGKLARAMEMLKPLGDGPALYCGRLRLVGAGLEPAGLSPLPARGLSFGNALVENAALGPSIVVNRAAAVLLASRLPERAVMHDAWMYLVASAMFRVIYDPEPLTLYRLHPDNHIGVDSSLLARWRRLATGRLEPYIRGQVGQARELARLFQDDLPTARRRTLARFCSLTADRRSAMVVAASRDIYRQRRLDDMLWRVAALSGPRYGRDARNGEGSV